MTGATAANGESPAIRNLIRDWRNELAFFDGIRSWRMSSLSHRFEAESRGYKEDLPGERLIPTFSLFIGGMQLLMRGTRCQATGVGTHFNIGRVRRCCRRSTSARRTRLGRGQSCTRSSRVVLRSHGLRFHMPVLSRCFCVFAHGPSLVSRVTTRAIAWR